MGEDDSDPRLIAEQLKHMASLFSSKLGALESDTQHNREFLEFRIKDLEKLVDDHEIRIRSNTETKEKQNAITWLIPIGAALMSLLAFIKAWIIN